MNLYLDNFTIIIKLIIVGSAKKQENRTASCTQATDFCYLE